VLFAGALFAYDGPVPGSTGGVIATILANWRLGIPFAASLLAILLAHEFGHYLAARYHKTHVTLPYFIPFPLSPLGTMGAFIQLKDRPRNKRILHDIGVAGPLAGLVVAVPLLIYGLSLSEVSAINGLPGQGFQIEGNSILYLLSKFLVFRQWLPEPLSYGNLPPLIYWVRYFFTGQPLPLGGMDVMIHPVAWAAWAGLLVTALNLIPAGQLDGGHLIYVLIGNKARKLVPFILVALALLGFAWSGWWLWALLILFLGRRYAEPLDQITPLDTNRRLVAAFGLLVFILVFTPVPLMQFSFGG
jgi:membrane-associated protease RseP (regulator of RpoE activity)